MRANRPKLRKLLSTGLDMRMDKTFKHYEIIDEKDGGGVRAYFADGSVYEGEFLIGCEGAASNGEFCLPSLSLLTTRPPRYSLEHVFFKGLSRLRRCCHVNIQDDF